MIVISWGDSYAFFLLVRSYFQCVHCWSFPRCNAYQNGAIVHFGEIIAPQLIIFSSNAELLQSVFVGEIYFDLPLVGPCLDVASTHSTDYGKGRLVFLLEFIK